MVDRHRIELLITVARRYWIDQVGQQRIAEEIGYSRSMVSRLLDEARSEGVITFTVGHPLERAIELENSLISTFGLTSARVSLSTPTVSVREVTRLGADLLDELLDDDSVLAVTNGRTVAEVAQSLPRRRRPNMTVVQALGVIAHDNHLIDSHEICQQFASSLGAPYHTLPAPLVVSSQQMAQALHREGRVATSLAMASHADVLITGIGATTATTDGAIFNNYVTADEHNELLRSGAVGHIGAHHINAKGQHIDLGFCQRLIAVPFDRLREISNVVAVAWGPDKVPAIRAALLSGVVDHFVTDAATADLLFEPSLTSSAPKPRRHGMGTAG